MRLAPKREGDISDSFASLSGVGAEPLPDSYRQLKLSLVDGHEDEIQASWKRLLKILKTENDIIAQHGPQVVPELRFSHLEEDLIRLEPQLRKRGVAVIRDVIREDEARAYKGQIEAYVRKNPSTKGKSLSFRHYGFGLHSLAHFRCRTWFMLMKHVHP